jgi:Winged helix DNA-binding domain
VPEPSAARTRGGGADGGPISRRELNRALLARQHLLARTDLDVPGVTAHLVGLQAQAPWAPYTGLWTRIAGLTHADLADRLLDRTLVRIVAMRGTVHLLVADDALVLPALSEPILRRTLRTAQGYASDLRDVDLDALAESARTIVEAQPTGTVALGRQLAERWPDVDPKSLAYAARCTLPLVQVPPRAVWGRSGATTWTTTRAWLGREQLDVTDPDRHTAALDQMVLRYLGAFGPATVADVQTWSGLGALAPVLDRLRPRLVTFRPDTTGTRRTGRELFDLPDAPRPDPDAPAPVRFLPEFDNLLLSHADRSRVISDEYRRRMWRANGAVPGALLVDGEVAGHWTVTRAGRHATLVVTAFHAQPREVREEVEDEGRRLVTWVADDAADHDVVWHQDGGTAG